MLKFGIISEVAKGKVRVSFEEDGIVSNWLPVIVDKSLTDKTSYPLEPNEHVACMMDEHMEYGVVLGAIYNDEDAPDSDEGPGKFRKKFSDGTLIEYNKNTHKLTVDVSGGNIEIKAAGNKVKVDAANIEATATVKVKAMAPLIELTGNVVVSGTLAAAGITSSAGIATTGGTGITATGDFTIAGNVVASGNVSAAQVTASGKNLAGHVHAGVQTGSGSTAPL